MFPAVFVISIGSFWLGLWQYSLIGSFVCLGKGLILNSNLGLLTLKLKDLD